MQLFQDGKEKAFNIVVVGTGGTGSQLLPFLTQLCANVEETKITVVDGDTWEQKNMLNQKCIDKDLGKPKAETIGIRYKKVYPPLDIHYQDDYVRNKKQLVTLLNQGENSFPILVGCVDNNATRKLFHEVFHDETLPELIYIDSGNGTDDMLGQVVVGYKKITGSVQIPHEKDGYNTYCCKPICEIMQPPVADVFTDILDEKDSIDKVLSCANPERVAEAPQNIATNILAATTMFCILNQIITFSKIPAHTSYFDAKRAEIISR